ncbi:MAG TPA: RluA family pseudouridine synthase [Polyangia bacterium]|nr:RluA family pseudouridine synthase [Polyangia bacterium]
MARARIPPEAAGQRIDHAVAAAVPGLSVARARRLLQSGAVRIDGRRARKGAKIGAREAGATIEIDDGALGAAGDGAREAVQPDAGMPLVVLHEDDTLVAIAKPAGVPSHPIKPGQGATAANALVARFPECAGAAPDPREAGLVHRLDTGTSGVLIAARSAHIWPALRAALTADDCEKTYLAEVIGAPADSGVETAPIGRVGRRSGRVRVGGGRQPLAAETAWQVLERRAATALVRVQLSAGRHHQVRAHLAAAGHPIAGDTQYGPSDAEADADVAAFHLHAASIRFRHPISGETILIEAPPPDWAKIRA